MKKVVSCTLLVCLTIICLMMQPFLVFADNEPISGFDYTNYYELEYIESSGTQYIVTSILPNSVGRVIAKVKFNNSNRQMILASWNSTYSSYLIQINRNNKIQSSATGVNPANTTQQDFSTSNIYTFDVNYNSNYFKLNDSTINTLSGSPSGNRDLYIFASNDAEEGAYLKANARIYYLTLYNTSGVMTYNFIPAERKSDGVYGFYDTVNSNFYTNSGSGTFTAGSRISYTTQYTISTAVSPSGSGTITGGGTYDENTQIQLTATASSGYAFEKWSDENTSNPRIVTVTQNATYTAIFEEITTPVVSYTITTSVSPAGSGSVTGGGTYTESTVVSLSATPNTGYSFSKWSDDVTSNPRSVIVTQNTSYTAIFTQNSNPEPDPSPSGWSDWTDTNDSSYYEEVTSSIDLSKLKWTIYKNRVIDYVVLFGDQYQVNSGLNGSNINHISFTGSYYDNSIVGLNGCNSTSYNYSSSSSNQVDVLTIEPAIYGSFDAPTIGQDGTVFNFGIAVNGGTSSNVTTSTNGFSNTTEACRLIGMNTGDGSVDGTTLLALGYQKKTITYNDGSTNGHTATVYVPGSEDFEFAADLSFLDDLFEQLYVNVVSNLHVWGHDEYTLQMQPEMGYYVPDTGYLWSKAFIGSLLEKVQFTSTSPIQNTNKTFYIVPQDNTSASIDYQGQFDYSIQNNEYYLNRTYLYWKGTTKPKWVFKTNTIDMSQYNDIWGNNMYVWDTYGRSMTYISSHTVTSADVTHDSNLTLGALIYTGIENIHFYELKNNSILNRFNQLGSMMYGWFNRIYQAIGNITGGNESNEIINNVVEDYDIDVEINFNGLLSDVFTKKQDIDLNDPEYVVPSVDHSAIHSLAEAMENIYDKVYIQNGIGIVIFAPLILLVLRLIL